MDDELVINGVKYRKVVEPAPEPPALRYHPGDVVLMPVRVMEVDDSNPELLYEYKVEPVGGRGHSSWLSRAALEGGEAPKVGDKCLMWKRDTDVLKWADYVNHRYINRNGNEYPNAVKLP
jgi:hypothetical protein